MQGLASALLRGRTSENAGGGITQITARWDRKRAQGWEGEGAVRTACSEHFPLGGRGLGLWGQSVTGLD